MRFDLNKALIIGLLILATYIILAPYASATEAKGPTDAQKAEYFQARAAAVEAAANFQQFNVWAQGESEKRRSEADKAGTAARAAFDKLPKPPAGKVYDERTLELKDAPKPTEPAK